MTQFTGLACDRKGPGHSGWFLRVVPTAVLALALALAAGTPALAEEGFSRGSKDNFSISLGTYLIDFDTRASLSSDTFGNGTDINFENDLGLTSKQTRTRLEGYWRFARKHRLDFAGYFYNRTADRVLSRQITWGDVVYDAGVEMHSQIKSQFYKLDYKYSFIRNAKWELLGSFGLSTISTKAELDGVGTIGGVGEASFQKSSKGLVAPIPVFGVHAEWNVFKSLYLRGGAEYLAVNVSGWQGSVTDLRASLDWYPFKHFGFGAGYNTFHIDAKRNADLTLDFRYGFSGLLGYATYVF